MKPPFSQLLKAIILLVRERREAKEYFHVPARQSDALHHQNKQHAMNYAP